MRQIAHKLLGAASWILVGVLWFMVVRDGRAAQSIQSTVLELSALAGVVLAVTLWWVRHNVGIYRRKGPRRGSAASLPHTDQDRLGRAVCWSLPGGAAAASRAQRLVVEVDADIKTYRPGD